MQQYNYFNVMSFPQFPYYFDVWEIALMMTTPIQEGDDYFQAHPLLIRGAMVTKAIWRMKKSCSSIWTIQMHLILYPRLIILSFCQKYIDTIQTHMFGCHYMLLLLRYSANQKRFDRDLTVGNEPSICTNNKSQSSSVLLGKASNTWCPHQCLQQSVLQNDRTQQQTA